MLKAHQLDGNSVNNELDFRAQVSARLSPINDRKAESMTRKADCAPSTSRLLGEHSAQKSMNQA
jgi:hypothetical protein